MLSLKSLLLLLLAIAGTLAAGYAALVAVGIFRFGRPPAAANEDRDEMLDRFMPAYDVVERHRVKVRAPADITYTSACGVDIRDSPIVRAIFEIRSRFMGAGSDDDYTPQTLVPWAFSIGWNLLAEEPEHEVVLGSVTEPWSPSPEFRRMSLEAFLAFDQPGFVKIAWTLRADPTDSGTAVLRHETRAAATDDTARDRFRRYWSFVWPGLHVIRLIVLRQIRQEAEALAGKQVNGVKVSESVPELD